MKLFVSENGVFPARPWAKNTAYLSRILAVSDTSNPSKRLWRLNAVAAFCECCGALITLKAEACPACGTPQHGMLLPDPLPLEGDTELDGKDDGSELRRP
jgi:hypothetical protein